jgi:hypothetical protein
MKMGGLFPTARAASLRHRTLGLSGLLLAQNPAILDRFGNVGLADGWLASQISDGTGHFQHPVIGAGRPVQFLHGSAQQGFTVGVGAAVLIDVGAGKQVVALVLALLLQPGGAFDAHCDLRRGFATTGLQQLCMGYGGYLNLHVDAVEQGAGDFALVVAIVIVRRSLKCLRFNLLRCLALFVCEHKSSKLSKQTNYMPQFTTIFPNGNIVAACLTNFIASSIC